MADLKQAALDEHGKAIDRTTTLGVDAATRTRSGFTHEDQYTGGGIQDEWRTPKWIFDALGTTFDLDPCSPMGGVCFVPASNAFTKLDDGLTKPWDGFVWMNPPYGSSTLRWAQRFANHKNGIALVFARTSTRWARLLFVPGTAVCFPSRRVPFVKPTGETGGSPGADSMLVAMGEVGIGVLRRCGLGPVATFGGGLWA
jgi:hypothetical protein